MFTKEAEKHFDQLWSLFDRRWLKLRGSRFLVDPFRPYFSRMFVENLTRESAHDALHIRLAQWGRIEQTNHEMFKPRKVTLEGHKKLQVRNRKVQFGGGFLDPEVGEMRGFVISAYYNLVCLAAHKLTIEELTFLAYRDIRERNPDPATTKAFYWLVGISNSFLLAEWAHDLIQKAIANDDRSFFNGLRRWIVEDTPEKRFSIARTWLGVTLMWYLGGKNLRRLELMHVLKQKGILAQKKTETSFNADLRKLRLIK